MKARGLPLAIGFCALACSATPAPKPIAAAKRAPPVVAAPAPDPEPWRNRAPTPGPSAPLSYPEPEVARLANGVTLYVLRRPAGIVELEWVVRNGAGAVPPGKSGLAALTARMLTEGTARKSSLELAEAVESLGTTLHAEAGRDHSEVALSTLLRDFVPGLELLAEVVQTPRFDATDFQRVQSEWLDGLLAERQEPQQIASLVALRRLLGPSTGAPVSGSMADVKALTVPDLKSFHAQNYMLADSALIVVGDLTLADVRPHAERIFRTARARAHLKRKLQPLSAHELAKRSPVLLVDRPEAVQTALFVIQTFPKRGVPGHEAREILSDLFGGLFTSRINQNLREEHAYTYGARSHLIATRSWGAFAVTTSVKSDVSADALTELYGEFEKLRDPARGRPIGAEEIARAKTDLINSLGAHLEDTGRIAGDLAASFVEGLPTDYESRYPPLIESITSEAVVREAARLTPNELLVVAVGDAKLVRPDLEKHGFTVQAADPSLLE